VKLEHFDLREAKCIEKGCSMPKLDQGQKDALAHACRAVNGKHVLQMAEFRCLATWVKGELQAQKEIRSFRR
jgi:hypothetical protein